MMKLVSHQLQIQVEDKLHIANAGASKTLGIKNQGKWFKKGSSHKFCAVMNSLPSLSFAGKFLHDL
jgi:hypothetical protein